PRLRRAARGTPRGPHLVGTSGACRCRERRRGRCLQKDCVGAGTRSEPRSLPARPSPPPQFRHASDTLLSQIPLDKAERQNQVSDTWPEASGLQRTAEGSAPDRRVAGALTPSPPDRPSPAFFTKNSRSFQGLYLTRSKSVKSA